MTKQLGHQEVKSLSLYDRETEWKQLETLLARDGLESGEDQEALVALIEKEFLAVQDKRDSFCAFLAFLDIQASFAASELARLELRKKRIEAANVRLQKLAVQTIQSLGQDDNGKWKRLEGHTSSLSLAKNPSSVEVVEPDKVPAEFKRVAVTLTMPLAYWNDVMEREMAVPLIDIVRHTNHKWEVDLEIKEIGKALKEMLPCTECGQLGIVRDEDPTRPVEVSKCIHCEGHGCCHCKETGIEGTIVNLKVCPSCNGEKQVPRQVPGARLVADRVRLVRK